MVMQSVVTKTWMHPVMDKTTMLDMMATEPVMVMQSLVTKTRQGC